MTYTLADKERDQKHADDRDKRIKKRETFLGKFEEYGLEYEIQDSAVSHIIIGTSLTGLHGFDQVTFLQK